MKQKLFLLTTTLLSVSILLFSFLSKPFAYTLSAIDPARGTIKATLEQSTAVFQKKGKPTATTSSFSINNPKSAVRIKMADAIFQSYSDKSTALLGPEDYISLYKLTTSKTGRTFTINSDGTTNSALIPISFAPTDVQVNKISPTQGLIPGEYAFVDRSTTTADGNITVWCFGID